MAETPERRRALLGGGSSAFLTLGLQLAIAVVAFVFLGRWLDEKFDASPWFTLSGAAVGIAGGMIKFIKSAQELGRMADKEVEDAHHDERQHS